MWTVLVELLDVLVAMRVVELVEVMVAVTSRGGPFTYVGTFEVGTRREDQVGEFVRNVQAYTLLLNTL